MSAEKNEDIILPRYVRDFADMPLDEKQQFFKRLQVTDPINEKIFEFLCAAIATEVSHGKKARIELRRLLEKILRWSSNPNNFRTLPGFPRGEEVLKNRLNPFLAFLEEKGICRIDRVEERDRHAVYLYLLPEVRLQEAKRHKAFLACRKGLHTSYEKAASEMDEPFPAEEDVVQWLRKEPRLPVKKIHSKQYNRHLIEESLEAEEQLFQISFDFDGSSIFVTSDQLALLFQIAISRLRSYMHLMLNNQTLDVSKNSLTRVDFLLRDTHHAAHPDFQISVQRLYEQLTTSQTPFMDQPEIWCTLAHKLVSEVARSEKESAARKTKMQTFSLLFGYFSHEHDLKRQKEQGVKVLESVFKDLTRFDRLFSFSEIIGRTEVKQYIDTFSKEVFVALFDRFIQRNSLERGKSDVSDALLVLESENDERYYLCAGHLLSALEQDLSRAAHPRHGMRKINFVTYWADLLHADMYVPEVAELMTDEKAFYGYLAMLVKEQYPALFYIHEYLTKNFELLIYLCDKDQVPLRHYFMPNGRLKSLAGLLNINRLDVLRRAKHGIPFWRKIFLRVTRIFRRGGRKYSLWRLAERELSTQGGLAKEMRRSSGEIFSEAERKKALQLFASKELPVAGESAPDNSVVLDKKATKDLSKEISGGKSPDFFVTKWNPKKGVDGQRFRSYVDRILNERVNFAIEKINRVNFDEEIGFIVSDPRLDDIVEKDSLLIYTKLLVLDKLQEIEKTKKKGQ